MEHQQYNYNGPCNIAFQIESFCYKLMKTLLCLIHPEDNNDYFENFEVLEDIDLESQNTINNYKHLIKRNNNINIEQIIIEEYFEI